MVSDFPEYECWDLSPPVLPQPSRLYHLEPIGVGTPLVECLTSYIARLAEAHCVSTMVLIKKEIAPNIKEGYLYGKHEKFLGTGFGKSASSAINGFGIIASEWKDALETLTMRNDLSFLTMLPWSEISTHKNLLRRTQAWCPDCYEEWQKTGRIVYLPLLWTLNAVTVCPVHLQKLKTECKFCNNNLYFIDKYPRPGFCSKCGSWLNNDVNKIIDENHHVLNKDFQEQVWVANAIGNLLANAPSLQQPPTRGKIASSLSTCINQLSDGNCSAFARFVEIDDNLLKGWRNGRYIPQLNYLSKICHSIRISLCDFILKEPITEMKIPRSKSKFEVKKQPSMSKLEILKVFREGLEEQHPPTIKDIAKRVGYSKSNLYSCFPEECKKIAALVKEYRVKCEDDKWVGIESKIKNTLKDGCIPISMKNLAISLGCNQSTLYRKYPKLCHSVSNKYSESKRLIEYKNRIRKENKIRTIATELAMEGIYPSQKLVANILDESCNWKFIRDVSGAILSELGITKKTF